MVNVCDEATFFLVLGIASYVVNVDSNGIFK